MNYETVTLGQIIQSNLSLQVIKVSERTKDVFSKTALKPLDTYKNRRKENFPCLFAVILVIAMKHSVRFRVGKVEMHGLHALGTGYVCLYLPLYSHSLETVDLSAGKNYADYCLARCSLLITNYISNFRFRLCVCVCVMLFPEHCFS